VGNIYTQKYQFNTRLFTFSCAIIISFLLGCGDDRWDLEVLNKTSPLHPYRLEKIDLNGSVEMEMIWAPAGTFIMGSPESEKGRQAGREKQHEVILESGFFLGKYEVTQLQYQAVMQDLTGNINYKPSHFDGIDRPVEKVSWNDAQIFIKRLNQYASKMKMIPFGWRFSLPTESEWEYACRAGTQTTYSWGNTIRETDTNGASPNGAKETRKVGSYDPNPWGFYDMHGNVREWVHDWYSDEYPDGKAEDPRGPGEGTYRVSRGGSWNDPPSFLRSADRQNGTPDVCYHALGFRVCLKKD
jgi:formylglycine-generating enzyme required for sulfatase activity